MWLNELKLWGTLFENSFEEIPMDDDPEKQLDFLRHRLAGVKHRAHGISKILRAFPDNPAAVPIKAVGIGDADYEINGKIVSHNDFMRNYFQLQWNKAIPRTSNENNLLIGKYETLKQKHNRLEDAIAILETKIKKLVKETMPGFIKSGKDKIAKGDSISEDKIPKLIYYTNKNKFDNPYFNGPQGSRYAGPPEHFKGWTSQQMLNYRSIVKAFERNGLERPNVIFAARYKTRSEINFVILGTNGRFVWRKYGYGAGSMNVVYIDGKKYRASDLVSEDPRTQDAMLSPLKAPKS